MPRESKIHFAEPHKGEFYSRCGTSGRTNINASMVTCRICMYQMLCDVAPWARNFLENLRGKVNVPLTAAERATAGNGELNPISVPGASPKPMDSQEKGLGNGFARAFGKQGGAQKAVRELLTVCPACYTTVQPIVDHGGATAYTVGVQPGQVAEQPGDAGQISDESLWGY